MTTPTETSLYRTLSLGSEPKHRRRFMVVDEEIPGNFRFGLLLEELDDPVLCDSLWLDDGHMFPFQSIYVDLYELMCQIAYKWL